MEMPTEQPALLRIAPLPPLTSVSSMGGVQLTVLFHILSDGSVGDARILGSSGDSQWDSLASQSMKKWRFAEPERNHVAKGVWVRQLVVVQVQTQEPVMMILGELVCSSLREADSLYALIQEGTEFDSLAGLAMGTPSGGQGGISEAVDIMMYPRRIREELLDLNTNEVTRPVKVGRKYVIYKRYEDDRTKVVH